MSIQAETKKPDTLCLRGGTPLHGQVELSGSKNGSLPLLAATLLMDGECQLTNLPSVDDIFTMIEILKALGLQVELDHSGRAIIRNHGIKTHQAPWELAKRMRASFWVVGPLIARLGQARVPMPGGCQIGDRPVDFHIHGFQALGAQISENDGYLNATAPKLQGTTITQSPKFRSVGATINIAMAACLAEGTTIIENAAHEPEVVDFCNFLNQMGARISGIGTASLRIDGVRQLTGCQHAPICDRIEAGTYLLAGAITQGDLTVTGMPAHYLKSLLDKLEEAGVQVDKNEQAIRIIAKDRPQAVDIATAPYPGFATDLQPPTVALLCLAQGTSTVQETIYNDRLNYVGQLAKMGARIEVTGQKAMITGVPKLTGAMVEAHDIRGGIALVLAALAAEGESEIRGIHFIQRGYQNLEEKLAQVGAQLQPKPAQGG